MIRILVPVDFSAHSFNALIVASRLAELAISSIEVLYIKHYKRTRMGEIWNKKARDELHNENIDAVINRFIEDAGSILAKSFTPRYHIRETIENESESIAHFAESEGFDYILMGTLGADAFKNVLLGSTTFNLTEISKVPVIAIPEECQCTTIKKVGYAMNFRKIAEKPLHHLVQIVQVLDAKLICLHVDYSETQELLVKADKLEQQYGSLGNIRFEVIQALDVPDGIFNYIQEREVDFLAIGHRKESFLKKLFRFSYTENLLLHSHVPVMVFPPEFG